MKAYDQGQGEADQGPQAEADRPEEAVMESRWTDKLEGPRSGLSSKAHP